MIHNVTDTPYYRGWIQELLVDPSVKDLHITFTKADGTERKMRGTLIESHIPSDKTPKGVDRAWPENVQRVFDRDVGEWRSFRWDSIKCVEYSL